MIVDKPSHLQSWSSCPSVPTPGEDEAGYSWRQGLFCLACWEVSLTCACPDCPAEPWLPVAEPHWRTRKDTQQTVAAQRLGCHLTSRQPESMWVQGALFLKPSQSLAHTGMDAARLSSGICGGLPLTTQCTDWLKPGCPVLIFARTATSPSWQLQWALTRRRENFRAFQLWIMDTTFWNRA